MKRIALLFMLFSGAIIAPAAVTTIPHQFMPGTSLLSADVNADFQTVWLNSLNTGSIWLEQLRAVVGSEAVDTSVIRDGAITHPKLAVNAVDDTNIIGPITGSKIDPHFDTIDVVNTATVGGFKMTTGAVDGYAMVVNSGVGTWQSIGAGMVPTGSMVEWSSATPPGGWLICDGTAVSRSTYGSLYGVIGTIYGIGDGSTTFNLPNWSGRMGIGVNGTYTIGSTGGAATHTHTGPSHTHTGPLHFHSTPHISLSTDGTTVNDLGTNIGIDAYGYLRLRNGTALGQVNAFAFTVNSATGNSGTDLTGASGTGATGSASSLPPYLATFKIIKF